MEQNRLLVQNSKDLADKHLFTGRGECVKSYLKLFEASVGVQRNLINCFKCCFCSQSQCWLLQSITSLKTKIKLWKFGVRKK